ncbi:hypothetical protein [Streptomyces sp. NPDC059943]
MTYKRLLQRVAVPASDGTAMTGGNLAPLGVGAAVLQGRRQWCW